MRLKWFLRRFILSLALVVSPAILLGTFCIVYVQLDKTEVFKELKGQYGKAVVISKKTTDTSTTSLVAFQNQRGETLTRAYVRVPHQLADDYDVMQTYAGRRTGEQILSHVPEANDLVLVAMQYPYKTPDTEQADFVDTVRMILLPYEVRQAAFKAVAGGIHAVTYLRRVHGIPPGRVTVVGASLGTFFATIQVALDDRVPRLLIVQGGGHFPTIWRHILDQENVWWGLDRFVVWFIDTFVGTFDPLHWIGRIDHARVYFIATTDDRYFPEKSIRMLYNRANQPKQITWMDAGHVSNNNEKLIRDIINIIEGFFENLEYQQSLGHSPRLEVIR